VARQSEREQSGPSFPSPESLAFAGDSAACSSLFAAGRSLDANDLGVPPVDYQVGDAAIAVESIANFVMVDDMIDGDMSMDPFIDFMGNNSLVPNIQNQGPVQIDLGPGPVTERSGSPADAEVIRAYEKMVDFCVSLAGPSSTNILSLSETNQIHYRLTTTTCPKFIISNPVVFSRNVGSRGISTIQRHHCTTL
jgi:hypothetical protein